MLKRFLPVLILAFIVGALFRLGDQFGIAVLRMFATQGIVVIGFLGAATLKRLQVEEGLRQLEEGFQNLPKDTKVKQVGQVRRYPVWLIEQPQKKLLVSGSDVANSTRWTRAAARLGAHAHEMLRVAQNGEVVQSVEGVQPALVLLRRAVREGERELQVEGAPGPIKLINPEDIPVFVTSTTAKG